MNTVISHNFNGYQIQILTHFVSSTKNSLFPVFKLFMTITMICNLSLSFGGKIQKVSTVIGKASAKMSSSDVTSTVGGFGKENCHAAGYNFLDKFGWEGSLLHTGGLSKNSGHDWLTWHMHSGIPTLMTTSIWHLCENHQQQQFLSRPGLSEFLTSIIIIVTHLQKWK